MRIIFEEYGALIISVIAAVLILALIFDLISPSGSLNELICKLADSAC